MEYQYVSYQKGSWKIRERIPPGDGAHPTILMLHGWTGDEKAMWVFESHLPSGVLLISLRALFKASLGGYSWYPQTTNFFPALDEFGTAIEALESLLNQVSFPTVDFTNLQILGFSQGAALAFAFALIHPERVNVVAGLSGFLPDKVSHLVAQQPLEGKHIFLAHGTQDELIPIARARNAAQLLGEAGARVTFCEDDVGHKLSASCFKSLKFFFRSSLFQNSSSTVRS